MPLICPQYDAVGWAPKEYNPDDKQSTGGQEQGGAQVSVQKDGSAPQSGFVWDEASGYYYDAASGFYYDGNTGIWKMCLVTWHLPHNHMVFSFDIWDVDGEVCKKYIYFYKNIIIRMKEKFSIKERKMSA